MLKQTDEITSIKQDENRDDKGRFLKGATGNPYGCPKGTKQRATKIRDTFFQVFFDEFGDLDNPSTIKRLRTFSQMHETEFLRILAGLLPKDLEVSGDVGRVTQIVNFSELIKGDKCQAENMLEAPKQEGISV